MEIESYRLDFYKRVSEARFMRKKNKQTNHIGEEALYIREGEEPREKKKKKKKKERERRSRPEWVALKCRRGTMGGWVGFRSKWVTLRLVRNCGLGLARAWVVSRPGSLCGLGLARWCGSGMVWLDQVVGSLVL